ncbi:MAG: hypothetical protein II420_00020, partial [Oscillospiraceae bacterium]|nr:hypothetical protein [Oscillospiraceae bacterium]
YGATFFARGGKEGKTPLEPAVQDSRQTEVTAIPIQSVLKSGFAVGESVCFFCRCRSCIS